MTKSSKVISQAPGRVCLFGEHQDYLELPVIAAAISKYLWITAEKNNAEFFRIHMPDICQSREIWIHEPFHALQKRDYFGSMLRVLKRYGCIPSCGYDIEIRGEIPISAGASSSSALTVAWGQLLLKLFGADVPIDSDLLARAAFTAEVKEHGEPGGLMDQFTISKGNVIHIQTYGNYKIEFLTKELDGLIVGDSKVEKKTLQVLAGTKEKVFGAMEILKRKNPGIQLSHITPESMMQYLKELPDTISGYFKAAVLNHFVTKQALFEFRKKKINLAKIGKLMNQHHEILRDLLKITVPKIDKMIEVVLSNGALGAKINGSGGGGTIVVLAPGKEDHVIEALRNVGAAGFSVKVDPGARIV